MKLRMDENMKKTLKGCKAAGVLLWICFGASILGCVSLLAYMMSAGNGAALSLMLMLVALPFLFCWGAKSALKIARWVEANVTDEDTDSDSEQYGEEE